MNIIGTRKYTSGERSTRATIYENGSVLFSTGRNNEHPDAFVAGCVISLAALRSLVVAGEAALALQNALNISLILTLEQAAAAEPA